MDQAASIDAVIEASAFRRNVYNLIPEGASHVLDFGCGTGGLLLRLKRDKKCTELYGVEVVPDEVEFLRTAVDKVWVTNVEVGDFESEFAGHKGFFNWIILHDVVEHLFDPWFTLTKIRSLLAPDGKVIIATPNLHYWGLQREIMQGHFPYGPGLWHTGHLRWYTPISLIELMVIGGLSIREILLEIPQQVDLGRYPANREVRHFQIPPPEFREEGKEVVTLTWERDVRAYLPVFYAHKIIAVCGKGELLEEPAPMTYCCPRLERLRKSIEHGFDVHNPPPMTPLIGNAY